MAAEGWKNADDKMRMEKREWRNEDGIIKVDEKRRMKEGGWKGG